MSSIEDFNYAVQTIDRGLLKTPNFFNRADELKKCLTTRFGDPFAANTERFVWDYWNVRNQYCLLRTPLEALFPEDLCSDLLQALGTFAQKELGLMALSHPWVSAYVEGCYQEFHTDPNHGPWAFVFSLTPSDFFKNFSGGQTQIFKTFTDQIEASELASQAKEQEQILHNLPLVFNDLCVFDPRRPHKVNRVHGPENIMDARIVVHGWFTDPQPFLEGEVESEALQDIIDLCLQESESFFEGHALSGCAALKVTIDESNSESKLNVKYGRHHLVDLNSQLYLSDSWKEALEEKLHSKLIDIMPPNQKPFSLTLPIVYE